MVIGGGIIGASVAYHLTRLGVTDLVLTFVGPDPVHDIAYFVRAAHA